MSDSACVYWVLCTVDAAQVPLTSKLARLSEAGYVKAEITATDRRLDTAAGAARAVLGVVCSTQRCSAVASPTGVSLKYVGQCLTR